MGPDPEELKLDRILLDLLSKTAPVRSSHGTNRDPHANRDRSNINDVKRDQPMPCLTKRRQVKYRKACPIRMRFDKFNAFYQLRRIERILIATDFRSAVTTDKFPSKITDSGVGRARLTQRRARAKSLFLGSKVMILVAGIR